MVLHPIDLNSFNAQQARERSQNIVTEESKQQLEFVLKKVIEITNEGGLFYHHYETLQPSVVNELKKRGFDITHTSDQRDGVTYTIKW
jgi:hypothetical protein